MIANEQVIKLTAGGYRIPVTLTYDSSGKRMFVNFKYFKPMVEEIKLMEGAKWHGFDEPPRKIWSIANSQRNWFQLRYMMGENPYERYDSEISIYKSERPVYQHQKWMVGHIMIRRMCILAAEMGTGKSLAAIEAMELAGMQSHECLYVGPRAGVFAFERELLKWQAKVWPKLVTYEGLVKIIERWQSGIQAPKFVVFDESSKIKTPTAKRSKAARWLADAVRNEHGDNGFIVLMSGTPAPRSPDDWWHQCEVACPGFLREGSKEKFRARLCLIKNQQSITGGTYPQLITWLDDSSKCAICGQTKENEAHDSFKATVGDTFHDFKPSSNEIERLYKRLSGLVLVQFKKDCVDLPDKIFKVITVKPTVEILRVAKMITVKSRRAIEALTLLRELSDGFQYEVVETNEETFCTHCNGMGNVKEKRPVEKPDATSIMDFDYIEETVECDMCGGSGKVKMTIRNAKSCWVSKRSSFY